MSWEVRHADCLDAMRGLDEVSVDAIVCDPPYGIGFMGKEWDGKAIAEAAERDRATRKNLGPASPSRPGRAEPRSSSAFGNEAIIAGPVRGGIDFQAWCFEWASEALRILKPGGHLLAFGGTRTYHRLACAVEDAGFEIRDSLIWLYGSGFPKSLDVSKAIDKAAGAEREVVGERADFKAKKAAESRRGEDNARRFNEAHDPGRGGYTDPSQVGVLTAPATPEAQRWQGWGTALKPAHEPIVVARKPLAGTVAQNVTEHGTGALNVDGCRVGTNGATTRSHQEPYGDGGRMDQGGDQPWCTGHEIEELNAGRWPANVALSHLPECEQIGTRTVRGDPRETGNGQRQGGFVDTGAKSGDGEPNAPVYGDEVIEAWDCAPGCPVAELDRQSGERRSAGMYEKGALGVGAKEGAASIPIDGLTSATYSDQGGASRFFYTAKASRAERNAGLDELPESLPGQLARGGDPTKRMGRTADEGWDGREQRPTRNGHPTVKPIDLMRWLVRLVTPPGGLVLDPFTGSGTTGIACVLEDLNFLGIEREAEYVEIARARIDHWNRQPKQMELA